MRRYTELLGGVELDRCSILSVCSSAGRAQLWCRVLLVAGPLLLMEPDFGVTQEEQLSGIRWNVVACRIAKTVCVLRNIVLRGSDVDADPK